MEHKQFESKYGIVHYWIHKNLNENAKCILFSHGVCADHEIFNEQVKYFENDYSLITYDIPLHGLSNLYSNFSYENIARDLNSILENENIKEVVLVGMSAGGYVSQEFAFLYPEKVIGFIGIDTTPFGISYYSKLDLYFINKIDSMAKYIPNKFLRNVMAKTACYKKSSYKLMMSMLNKSSKNQIIEQLKNVYKSFLKENKDTNFEFPVLILLGEHDRVGSVIKYSKNWAKKDKHPIHIIKDAGHFSNNDNYESVNEKIETFLFEI